MKPPEAPVLYSFDSELWLWATEGATWAFVTVPNDISDAIEATIPTKRGFGSVRVEVTIGTTTWRTSLFPDKSRGAYILPIKKAVRKAESLDIGEPAHCELEPIVDG